MGRAKTESTIVGGVRMELYPIGKLAERIGRSPLTVRRWHRDGIIPKAMFKNGRGWRMYTSEEIGVLSLLFEECGMRQGLPIEETSFSKRAVEEMEKLKNKYKGMIEKEQGNGKK